MANPRYNTQVTQPRGSSARVGKMGGGMMRPMYKKGGRVKKMGGGRIAGAARRAQEHGYYTPDMGMKGGKMFRDGGKVGKKKPRVKVIGIGKAKDYPGIKKIIEMNKKGKKRFKAGGVAMQRAQAEAKSKSLKKVRPEQKGLKKLSTTVRNKMGFMKDGGKVKKGRKVKPLSKPKPGSYEYYLLNRPKHSPAPIKPQKKKDGGLTRNTRRMNRLEELGRVDAERADTRRGRKNLGAEKSRIIRELNRKKDGGTAKKYKKFKEPGGGGYNKPGPHKVDQNRRTTEKLFGRGKITDAITKMANKFDKPTQEKWRKSLQKRMDKVNEKNRKGA